METILILISMAVIIFGAGLVISKAAKANKELHEQRIKLSDDTKKLSAGAILANHPPFPDTLSVISDEDLELCDLPVCPYCGYNDDAWWEIVSGDDGEETEASCARCGNEYRINVDVKTLFTTSKLEPAND